MPVEVGVAVAVEVGVPVAVAVGVGVAVGVAVGVPVGVAVNEGVGVSVAVAVAVEVGVGVGVTGTPWTPTVMSRTTRAVPIPMGGAMAPVARLIVEIALAPTDPKAAYATPVTPEMSNPTPKA